MHVIIKGLPHESKINVYINQGHVPKKTIFEIKLSSLPSLKHNYKILNLPQSTEFLTIKSVLSTCVKKVQLIPENIKELGRLSIIE